MYIFHPRRLSASTHLAFENIWTTFIIALTSIYFPRRHSLLRSGWQKDVALNTARIELISSSLANHVLGATLPGSILIS